MQQIFNSNSINTEIGLKVLLTLAFTVVLWLLRRAQHTALTSG